MALKTGTGVMVEPHHRRDAEISAKPGSDPLDELARVVSGQFERRRPMAPEVAVETSAVDFEAELIRQMDSPQSRSEKRAVEEAPRVEVAGAPVSAAPVSQRNPFAPQPKRSLATPVASPSTRGQTAATLPAHSAPSLDSSLEDQLLGELGLDVELFGNVAKRRRPKPEEEQATRQFAEALESELEGDPAPKDSDNEDLDALAQEFSAPEEAAPEADEQPGHIPGPQPRPQAFSEIDLDFGKAFKTAFEKIESDRSARVLKEQEDQIRSSLSLANASENALESHFASAFADELAIGVSSLHKPKSVGQDGRASDPARTRPAVQETRQAGQAAARQDGTVAEHRQQQSALHEESQPFELADGEFDTALQEEMLAGESEYGAPVRPQRRVAKYAAIGFGIALVAAAGAVGYLYFAGNPQSGATAFIRADTDPVKIKPENKGGTEVANSDKAAYERLSGKFNGDAKQEKLVDSAENPIEIARKEPAASAGAEEETIEEGAAAEIVDDQAAADQDAAPEVVGETATGQQAGQSVAVVDESVAAQSVAKTDERLPRKEEEGAKRTLPGALAIEPRRVRTVTVRADGTIVPPEQTAVVQGQEKSVDRTLANQAEEAGSAAAQVADQIAKTNSIEPVKVATVRIQEDAQAAAGGESAPVNDAAASEKSVQTAALETNAGANLARGEWAVQVSSQRTPEEAAAAFRNLQKKFPALLEGRQMAVQRADLGEKGTFYRVRITAPTKEEAAALCDKLKAASGSCFVTR